MVTTQGPAGRLDDGVPVLASNKSANCVRQLPSCASEGAEPLEGRLYTKFRTENHFYIYDTSTNHILQVSTEVWNRVDAYLAARASGSGIPDRHEPVAREIEEGLSRGFLAPCNVPVMRFYRDEAQLRASVTSRLPHLTLELTQTCNLRCHYCPYAYQAQRYETPQRMSWQTLTNAVDTFMSHSRDAKERSVSFWGGEPLLGFPLIQRTVGHVARRYPAAKPIYLFTTNGTLLSDAVSSFLIEHDFRVLVSLDGPAVVHDRHRMDRSGRPTFARVTARLQSLLAKDERYYRKRVRFNCVLTPDVDIAAVHNFFLESELTAGHEVAFNMVAPPREFTARYGRFGSDERRRLRLEMRTAVAGIKDTPADPLAAGGVKALLGIATRSRTPVEELIGPNGCCVPLLKKMHVTVAGDIHLCERMDFDNCVGNVNNGGIDVDAVESLVREYCGHAVTKCQSCWAFRLCTACYKDFMSRNQWCESRRQRVCGASRKRVIELLEDYASILETNPHAFDHLKNVTITRPI
jgi:uncharacterized protein